jgi:pyrroloquinoline quinone biosynthesis protein B
MTTPNSHPGLSDRLSRRRFLELAGFAAAGLGVAASGAARAVGATGRDADMYALVLGSAQDGGMPQAGCYSAACDSARTAADPFFVASLALVEPRAERYYLVDASPDLTRQIDLIPEDGFRRRAASRRPFDGIFLTHAHIGHYLGLAVLGRAGLGMAPTPCWCTQRMAEFLANNGPWSLMVDEGRLDLRPMEPGRRYTIDDQLEATAVLVPHRDEFSDTVGFLFHGPDTTLLYLPDIDRWGVSDFDIEALVARTDVTLLDGTFYSVDELPGRSQEEIPHPLIPDTMARLQTLVDEGHRVVFTHLNNTNPVLDAGSSARRDVVARGFEIAREGDRIGL